MARWAIALLVVVAAGCTSQPDNSAQNEIPLDALPVPVNIAFNARLPDPNARINGAAIYHRTDGTNWLIATTSNDVLAVFDAATGALIRTVGTTGAGLGELRGPEGIVVLGDSIALVVERGNARVQGFHLPDFTTIGTFGDRLIGPPKAIAAYLSANAYAVYIASDSGGKAATVGQFRLTVASGELIAIHWRTFGDTAGSGVLRSPQAIAVDAEHNRLLIADAGAVESDVKVYDTDGRFTRGLASGAGNVGGIGLVMCAKRDGYWITTVAGDSADTFHVFERASLAHVGVFADTLARTGRSLAVSGRGHGQSVTGSIFAARRDASVGAFVWRDIAAAIHIKADCAHN